MWGSQGSACPGKKTGPGSSPGPKTLKKIYQTPDLPPRRSLCYYYTLHIKLPIYRLGGRYVIILHITYQTPDLPRGRSLCYYIPHYQDLSLKGEPCIGLTRGCGAKAAAAPHNCWQEKCLGHINSRSWGASRDGRRVRGAG